MFTVTPFIDASMMRLIGIVVSNEKSMFTRRKALIGLWILSVQNTVISVVVTRLRFVARLFTILSRSWALIVRSLHQGPLSSARAIESKPIGAMPENSPSILHRGF